MFIIHTLIKGESLYAITLSVVGICAGARERSRRALRNIGTANSSNALAALSDTGTVTTSSKALGALAVAERDIRALRTARADSARSGD